MVRVQKGELADPDPGAGKFDLGTATLRMHAAKAESARALRDSGQCFSLVFSDRTIDFAAGSKAQRDFLAGGFELLCGKGDDFGKLIKVVLHSRGLADTMTLGNDWSSGALLVTAVVAGSEAEKAGLMAGDKVIKINGEEFFATMDAPKVVKSLKTMPKPVTLVVERTENLDHTDELHRQVQREKKLEGLLKGAGLSAFSDALVDFGIESVEDLTNYRIVNDDLLMSEDIGMTKEDVKVLRRALERHFYADS
jgi:hypothetical protein